MQCVLPTKKNSKFIIKHRFRVCWYKREFRVKEILIERNIANSPLSLFMFVSQMEMQAFLFVFWWKI